MQQQADDTDAVEELDTSSEVSDSALAPGQVAAAGEAPLEPAATSGPWRRPGLVDRLTWTRRQRRGMAVVLTVVLGVLVWRAMRNTAYISAPQPATPARFEDLADRLDPNTATWQELAAIPSLGEKRARAIVSHREDWQKRHPGETAYLEPLDLAAASGIGASMVEQMTPHLMFPVKPATGAVQ